MYASSQPGSKRRLVARAGHLARSPPSPQETPCPKQNVWVWIPGGKPLGIVRWGRLGSGALVGAGGCRIFAPVYRRQGHRGCKSQEHIAGGLVKSVHGINLRRLASGLRAHLRSLLAVGLLPGDCLAGQGPHFVCGFCLCVNCACSGLV